MYPERKTKSPNIGAGVNECLGVVFHHTGAFHSSVPWFMNPAAKVSAHVEIHLDGTRTVMADDHQVAWHAGESEFSVMTDGRRSVRKGCNKFMLGVEFTGDTNKQPLTDDQIHSAIEWIMPRMEKYDWMIHDLTDHRTVAPDRKVDLNKVEFDRLRLSISNARVREIELRSMPLRKLEPAPAVMPAPVLIPGKNVVFKLAELPEGAEEAANPRPKTKFRRLKGLAMSVVGVAGFLINDIPAVIDTVGKYEKPWIGVIMAGIALIFRGIKKAQGPMRLPSSDDDSEWGGM